MKGWQTLTTGDLREQVTIRKRTVTKSPTGADVETWSDRATVRAAVEQGVYRANEGYSFGLRQIVAQNPTRVTVRWRTDVSVRDQVLWNGRTLNVEAVRDPEAGRRRWLEILCTEVQA